MKQTGKRIVILFPDLGNKPIGGYKVLLQYANLFASAGYDVTIVYSCYYPLNLGRIHFLVRFLKHGFRYLLNIQSYSCRKWFMLDTRVEEKMVWSLYTSKVVDSDYYVATAAVTSQALCRFNVPAKNKVYFIQGYEPWQIGEAGLINTFMIDCCKIVVSKWLKKIVDCYAKSIYIPNGFDRNEFSLVKPIEERNPMTVSILYHELVDKGFKFGYEALCKVKQQISDLEVLIFGVYQRPDYLPDWFHYYQSPDLQTHNWINNEASIYVGSSVREGYGLTIGEAMMCGQAVVCTDNEGYREMAIPNENAIVCPVRDVDSLAQGIVDLMTNTELREKIAYSGYEYIQEYTIEKSFAKLGRMFETK